MSVEFNWFPGHMNKTLKEIEKRISIVDLVIEIVDARAPYSSQNPTFKKILKKKPMIHVISKADLADDKITQQWVEYFEKKKNRVMVLDDKSKNITKPLTNLINQATKEKQKKDQEKGIVNSLINVLVIGIPNVGKSTFINRLIKDKSVKVGNKPGVTRGIQNITLTKNITLIDTPGVLPAKLESETLATNLCAINSIKEDVFPRERISARLMNYLYNNYENFIESFYKISPNLQRPIELLDTYVIFEIIAKTYKWELANGIPDVERAIYSFFRNLSNGKIGKVSFEKPNEILEDDDLEIENSIGDITVQW